MPRDPDATGDIIVDVAKFTVHLDYIKDNLDAINLGMREMRQDHKESTKMLSDKIENLQGITNDLSVTGCAKGEANSRRIEVLEDAPKKDGAKAGGLTGAISAAIVIAFGVIAEKMGWM